MKTWLANCRALRSESDRWHRPDCPWAPFDDDLVKPGDDLDPGHTLRVTFRDIPQANEHEDLQLCKHCKPDIVLIEMGPN